MSKKCAICGERKGPYPLWSTLVGNDNAVCGDCLELGLGDDLREKIADLKAINRKLLAENGRLILERDVGTRLEVRVTALETHAATYGPGLDNYGRNKIDDRYKSVSQVLNELSIGHTTEKLYGSYTLEQIQARCATDADPKVMLWKVEVVEDLVKDIVNLRATLEDDAWAASTSEE